jgi:hypothetical protein
MGEALGQKSITRLDKNSLQELQAIYLERSAEQRGFPDSYCTKVSKDISEYLGFKYQEGHVKLDFPNNKGELFPTHAWCRDADGIIVDLTAHQFNPYLIKKFSEGVQIIRPKDPQYKRYTSLNNKVK